MPTCTLMGTLITKSSFRLSVYVWPFKYFSSPLQYHQQQPILHFDTLQLYAIQSIKLYHVSTITFLPASGLRYIVSLENMP